MKITKRNGTTEILSFDKILRRLRKLKIAWRIVKIKNIRNIKIIIILGRDEKRIR